ncbi:hypothetical protein BGZ99_003954, partial [Dissophora globulifera]
VNISGSLVLLSGDTSQCSLSKKVQNVQRSNAAGILIQSYPLGLQDVSSITSTLMISIEFQAGEHILAAIKNNPQAHVTFSTEEHSFPLEGGGLPSGFSSYGLDGELRSKPDLGAP